MYNMEFIGGKDIIAGFRLPCLILVTIIVIDKLFNIFELQKFLNLWPWIYWRKSATLLLIVFLDFQFPANDFWAFYFAFVFSPNETKKPPTLSKISDTTAWQKRRTKGKVAVQKMVVDLMELYLHRLKQKRTSYPKCPAMVEFAAQFLYEPTPDQKQVNHLLFVENPFFL